MSGCTRRQVLFYLGGIAITGFVSEIATDCTTSQRVIDAVNMLFERPGTRESAARIGREYLRIYPSQKSVSALSRSLDSLAPPRLTDTNRSGLTKIYADLIAEDFASVNLVNVDGWVLSKTEARVFGLLALT